LGAFRGHGRAGSPTANAMIVLIPATRGTSNLLTRPRFQA
jgi:hypothetical protein